jgi:cytochrome c oxidase cbb3-type subunit III
MCFRSTDVRRRLSLLTAAAGIAFAALTSCRREDRELRPAPSRTAIFHDAARESDIQPGGKQSQPQVSNPYEGNAYAISEGQRLYAWYNCSGCHFNGGGGIGPPLMKDEWIYGNDPPVLFDTIVKGRPNGMPSWGGRIPEYQVWQIVSYVRSMNKLEPQSATPSRGDNLEKDSSTIRERPGGVTR